ncbi:hypothetical protein EDB83DRAFT_2317588 [Lactarius deliciosus]|nr:hypothetical protein EDB83DRAFT_2317588 [Lactarius deliciosus]
MSRSLLIVDLSGIFFFAASCLIMSSQVPRKFAFAKQGLLGLLPWLEGDVGDAMAADELAQTFSVALEMVHLAVADAGVDVAVDSEVTDCLNLPLGLSTLHTHQLYLALLYPTAPISPATAVPHHPAVVIVTALDFGAAKNGGNGHKACMRRGGAGRDLRGLRGKAHGAHIACTGRRQFEGQCK